jgi:hypothetical protein
MIKRKLDLYVAGALMMFNTMYKSLNTGMVRNALYGFVLITEIGKR